MRREDCFDEMMNGWDEIRRQQRLFFEKCRKTRIDAQKYLMDSTFEDRKWIKLLYTLCARTSTLVKVGRWL